MNGHDIRSARATMRYMRAWNLMSNYRRSWAPWFVELAAKRRMG